MKLHLLDGTYELFRSYFGAPSRTAPNGGEIGAVHGVVASSLNLLAEDGVTHLGAAFDSEIRSFRNDLYGGYKTELGVPPELLAQFPIVEEAMEAIGVVTWRMEEYEADDALATAAARFADEVDQVVIMSPDKDMAQCIDGTNVVRVSNRPGNDHWPPSWSADGLCLAWQGDDPDPSIIVAAIDGGEPINLTADSGFVEVFPDWSPGTCSL